MHRERCEFCATTRDELHSAVIFLPSKPRTIMAVAPFKVIQGHRTVMLAYHHARLCDVPCDVKCACLNAGLLLLLLLSILLPYESSYVTSY